MGSGDCSRTIQVEGILLPLFFNTKEKWEMVTYSRSQVTEQVCKKAEVQDGHRSNNNTSTGAGELVFSPPPAGCLFLCQHTPCPQAFSEIYFGHSPLSMQGFTFWSVNSASSLLKDPRGSNGECTCENKE